MRHLAALVLLGLALSGCEQNASAPTAKGSAATSPAGPPARPSAFATAQAPAAIPAAAGGARTVSEQNDLYAFDYAYPAEAGALPALKALLDAELDRERAKLIASAKKGKAEAGQGGFPYHAYYRATGWQVVTDLPDWLSLSAVIESYEGGAHPNHWSGSLLWDKAQAKRRAPLDLFISKKAFSRALQAEFCAAIDRQRAEKRGEKIDRASGDMFTECIDPAEQTVILGSSNRRTFDRIGLLVAPYEAGPYVEGAYEATLPVTQAVLAAVRPEYRASFAVKR